MVMMMSEARAYLEQIREAEADVKADKERLEEMEEMIGIQASLYAVGGKNGEASDPTGSQAMKIYEVMEQVRGNIVTLILLKEKITAEIDKIDDTALRRLLKHRYVLGKRWDDVADTLGYERRYTLKLHGKELDAFGVVNAEVIRKWKETEE